MKSTDIPAPYYDFDPSVAAAVAEAHEQHANATFAELADRYDLSDGATVVPDGEYGKAFEILTLKPKGDYDETTARVLHLPMACVIDPAQAMQAMHTFAADPSEQMIVVGNAGVLGHGYGRLSLKDAVVVSENDLSPTVNPLLAYLRESGITDTRHIGSSYGAAKTMVASMKAHEFGINVSQAVAIDPPNVYPRTLAELAKAFKSTCTDYELEEHEQLRLFGHEKVERVNKLRNAIARPGIPAVIEAHRLADKGLVRYVLGLLRPTNIAIATALTEQRYGFGAAAGTALRKQPNMRAATFWGTKSELADDESMAKLTEYLDEKYTVKNDKGEKIDSRFFGASVQNMYHADINDVDLQTGLILQGLRETTPRTAAALALAS